MNSRNMTDMAYAIVSLYCLQLLIWTDTVTIDIYLLQDIATGENKVTKKIQKITWP